MFHVKRLFALILVFLLVIGMCACGGTSDENTTNTTQAEEETETTTKPTAPTQETESTEDAANSNYQVTVVDEAGAPIAGVLVQMCLESCVPGKTDENGVAKFSLEEADYKVSLLKMPDGYDYATEEQEWYFAPGEVTITVVLKAVA